MSVPQLLLFGILTLLLGSVSSLAAARHRRTSGWLAVGATGLAGVFFWILALRVFLDGPGPEVTLLSVPGIGAGLVLMVDGLSAFFLAIVATIGFLTTLFAVEYLDGFPGDSVAKYYPVIQVLFVGIVGVLAVADFFFFLVFWEVMTLAGYFLVAFQRENAESQRAALKYFVVNQGATLGMVAGVLILWRVAGSFHFQDLRISLHLLLVDRPLAAHLSLFLLFLGFSTKAGILPMGSWLPDAYPSAPTSATAAFAGAMSKLGIYGVVRVFLTLLPLGGAMEGWGALIALMGTGSLFVGTLTALKQDEATRLMAFHVVGQVGYMFLGVGMGLLLLPGHPVLGVLALSAGLFHLLNNALYKTALFLGAGAVQSQTGTTRLEGLGGLSPVMPWTAAVALGSSLAIAGVPPLNGFASKWLLYGTGILGGRTSPILVVFVLVAMFISLVTLASFLKYFGGAFLGPSREAGKGAREVGVTMVFPQVALFLGCVVFGLFPWLPLAVIQNGLSDVLGPAWLSVLAESGGNTLGPDPTLRMVMGEGGLAMWAPLPLTLTLLVLGLFVHLAISRTGGAEIRRVPIWTCGEEESPAALRYTAGNLYLPFKHAFRGVYPTLRIRPPRLPLLVRKGLNPDRWLYLPLVRWIERSSEAVSRTHVGVPQVYLLWIVLGAVVVVAAVLLTMA